MLTEHSHEHLPSTYYHLPSYRAPSKPLLSTFQAYTITFLALTKHIPSTFQAHTKQLASYREPSTPIPSTHQATTEHTLSPYAAPASSHRSRRPIAFGYRLCTTFSSRPVHTKPLPSIHQALPPSTHQALPSTMAPLRSTCILPSHSSRSPLYHGRRHTSRAACTH